MSFMFQDTLLLHRQSYSLLSRQLQRDWGWKSYNFFAWVLVVLKFTIWSTYTIRSNQSQRQEELNSHVHTFPPLLEAQAMPSYTRTLQPALQEMRNLPGVLAEGEGKEMVSHTKPASTPHHLNLVFTTLCLDETNEWLPANVAVHDASAYSQALRTENTALYWYEFLICSSQHCLHVTHKNISQKVRSLHFPCFISGVRSDLIYLAYLEQGNG